MGNMKKMRQRQRGFTLIELVMVIVILGVLAAVAIPKFVDLGKDARVATLNATRGSIGTAMAAVFTRSVLDGTEALASSSVTLSGVTIPIVYGYPAYGQGLLDAAGLSSPLLANLTMNGVGYVNYYFNETSSTGCAIPYTNATATSPAILGTIRTIAC